MSDDILSKILPWAESESSIRAVTLIGSRGTEGQSDELSDYDISFFTNDSSHYTQSEGWLHKIKNVWVCVHQEISWNGKNIPTRLVIFEEGIKVDFAFYPI